MGPGSYVTVELPPGSRKLPPVQAGDQGVSPGEKPHAEQAIRRLFEANGVDMVTLYDQATGTYELRSRTGSITWERWATPTGEIRYRVVDQRGDNPLPSVDGTILTTLEQEIAAAGGEGKPVPKDRNAYPDMFERMSQLFDHTRAPDFVYIPKTGADGNHPGAGSHGIPDIVQSRAPLVIAGPGIAHGRIADQLVRHEDVAPTIAELIGVSPTMGTNATGVRRTQLLKWQDGHSLAGGLVDARFGARAAAERAVMFVVDGLSQTVLLDEIKRGNLPHLARIVAAGTTFRNGTLAEYPTVTWANHNTLVTGASPGHTGIVNNSWWDRTRQREQLITDGGIKNSLRTGKLVDPEVETLYEAVERSFPDARTIAVNQPAGRGADISTLDLAGIPSLLGNIVKIGAGYLRGAREVVDPVLNKDKQYHKVSIQDNAAAAIGEVYWSKKVPPKLGVFEFTLVDNQGHNKGPHHPDARAALQEVDRQIGRVMSAMDQRGITDSTAIVLTADHGMEHQEKDPAQLGGWFDALKRASADGAKTKESTRFVYVRSVTWGVEGAVPASGAAGQLAIRVRNDDAAQDGSHPSIAGAVVTVTDGHGHRWSAVTGPDGLVRLPIEASTGPLHVEITHADFSTEKADIPRPGVTPA